MLFRSTSSADALIHAAESFLSPKSSPFTELYSMQAIRMIINGYKTIINRGGNNPENRKGLLKDFILAANYAGIAFGNAGCGAVHALSYAHGGAFHIAHGEANFICFSEVFKMYMRKAPGGKIKKCNKIFVNILECPEDEVYEELDVLLGNFLEKYPLKDKGMTKEQINIFAKSTVDNQQRLLAGNYVPLSLKEITEIFANLY